MFRTATSVDFTVDSFMSLYTVVSHPRRGHRASTVEISIRDTTFVGGGNSLARTASNFLIGALLRGAIRRRTRLIGIFQPLPIGRRPLPSVIRGERGFSQSGPRG